MAEIDLEIPVGGARAYLLAFGVAAVYLASAPSGEPCFVGVTRDLGRTRDAMRAKWPDMEITAAWWVRNLDHAHAIADSIRYAARHLDDGRFAMRAEQAAGLIVMIADPNIALTPHAVAMARVREAVLEIDRRLADANANGDLAWFNKAFKAWRQRAGKRGAATSYAFARARLRNEAIKRFLATGKPGLNRSLCASVFARKPKRKSKKKSLTASGQGVSFHAHHVSPTGLPMVNRRNLERLADVFLGEGQPPRLAKARSGDTVAMTSGPRRIKRLKRAAEVDAMRKVRHDAVSTFRTLPDEQRRALTSRFKQARQDDEALAWNDWLAENLSLTGAQLWDLEST